MKKQDIKILSEIIAYKKIVKEADAPDVFGSVEKLLTAVKKSGASQYVIDKLTKFLESIKSKLKFINGKIEEYQEKLDSSGNKDAREFFRRRLEETQASKEELLKQWKEALITTWKYVNPANRISMGYLDMIEKLKELGDKHGGTEIAKQLGAWGSEAQFLGGLGYLMAPVVLATLLVSASNKVYQRYFTVYAKACAGKSGKTRTRCIQEVKIASLRKQLNDLQKALTACIYSKNKKKCYAQVGIKIDNVTKKLKKEMKKL